jgi:hypothetical protein
MTSAPPAPPCDSSDPAPAPELPQGPAPVPDPPHGPGVFPPFPAPPVEGKGLRVGLSLGIGAALVLLICGGGLAAVIGLGATMTKALNEQAHVVVGDYLSAVQAKKYDEAYGMLCQSEKDRQTQTEFEADAARADPIRRYTVGDVDLATIDLTVPVDVTYADGRTGTLQVHLDQSPDTGQFQVCGVEE